MFNKIKSKQISLVSVTLTLIANAVLTGIGILLNNPLGWNVIA